MSEKRRSIVLKLSPQNSTPSLGRTVTINNAKRISGEDIQEHRNSKRYSMNAFFSMANEQDLEVEDELAQAQRQLRDLKSKISIQSKKNFILERDVRYLDGRIALLIKDRMALDEYDAAHLEETDDSSDPFPDDRKRQQYGELFFLLQSEPKHIATLARLVGLNQIDYLLTTVMFTIYGNQYESREEHLLLTMFQSVLASQFETTTEFGSLLRANTPVSRMMTTYTRRGPGQAYLKNVISPQINLITQDSDLNLEINPLKVYEQLINEILDKGEECDLPRGISAEEAANNEQVKAIIRPRLVKLREIANECLNVIISSIDKVPYGIRWICKQIRSLTKRKYPNATEFSICSLIGGFFFLRFINPAIITPDSYMLIDKVPSKNPKRTLTLLAKMLQNSANKPSYSKEAYMVTLNPFVEENKARINRFLNDLGEVGDFYETLEMDQYMALTKKEIFLNITLNEMYNTHQLLVEHQDTVAPPDSHLRITLDELGPPPSLVSRSENRPIDLKLFSRWEAPLSGELSSLTDNSITQSDILYMETKSLFVQIIRSLPQLAEKRMNLPWIAEKAANSKDPVLVRKGIKAKDMLRELEDIGIVNHRDGYKLMTEEVQQELVHLGNLKEKVKEEIESLQGVYETICDHNNYLRSQLEQYKAYLQNVRYQSGGGKTKSGAGAILKDKTKPHIVGPFKFTHHYLEKDGTIVQSKVPENRRNNIFFNIISPQPGTFLICLHYKGRARPILEMDLKLDDLLEKQQDNVQLLDLEYVLLNVNRLLNLLQKTFIKR